MFFKRKRRGPQPQPHVPAAKQVQLLMRDAAFLLLGTAVAAKALGLDLRRPAGSDGPAADDPSSFDRLEPGRGRAARNPRQFTRKAWVDVLWRVYKAFGGDRLGATAAGVAFYVVLGVFPGISAFVSLYGLFFDPAGAREQLRFFYGVLPPDALQILGDQMTRIAGAPSPGLSLAFVFSLALALWSANGAVKALFGGLNVAYHETEKRGFIRVNLISMAFTVGGILFILTVVSAVIVAPLLLSLFGVEGADVFSVLRWPVLLAVNILVLALVYRYGPSRATPRWRWVSWGSVAAAFSWLAASAAFSWYITSFGNYQATYGSLGAFAAFMIWTWLSVLIVLLGAELNASLEHQTAQDTTTGPFEPLGDRGALVADTIGPRRGSKEADRYTLNAARDLSRRALQGASETALRRGRRPPGADGR